MGLGEKCGHVASDLVVAPAGAVNTFQGMKLIEVEPGTKIKCIVTGNNVVVDDTTVVCGDGVIWVTPDMYVALKRNAELAEPVMIEPLDPDVKGV